MTLTRREVIQLSGGALAGLSTGLLTPEELRSEARRSGAEEPQRSRQDGLAEMEIRDRVELPLAADGSAPEHPESAAGPDRGGFSGAIPGASRQRSSSTTGG